MESRRGRDRASPRRETRRRIEGRASPAQLRESFAAPLCRPSSSSARGRRLWRGRGRGVEGGQRRGDEGRQRLRMHPSSRDASGWALAVARTYPRRLRSRTRCRRHPHPPPPRYRSRARQVAPRPPARNGTVGQGGMREAFGAAGMSWASGSYTGGRSGRRTCRRVSSSTRLSALATVFTRVDFRSLISDRVRLLAREGGSASAPAGRRGGGRVARQRCLARGAPKHLLWAPACVPRSSDADAVSVQ